MRLGASLTPAIAVPFTWANQITILGIELMADTERLLQLNISDIINKICILMSSWSSRALTPLGRIITYNSSVVSQFVYRLMCLYLLDDESLKVIKRLTTHFVWAAKTSKVAYSQVKCYV